MRLLNTLIFLPFTTKSSPSLSTLALNSPCTVSYLKRYFVSSISVVSFIATSSISFLSKMILATHLPMRPKPFIATFTAI
ncbi:hypothetical protein Cj8486_1445c [Campylobacter jejuni subsp. jejuni CG8486]|nr:hypothetical protein Cj8486_1445c [Campylobacter jejuni subsp. jejuni CG8486]